MTPKTNAEARLRQAVPCGVVRDTHEMTMVRMSDVQAIIESEDYYRQRAIALDVEREQLTATKDRLLSWQRSIKEALGSAITTLQNAGDF